VDVQLIRDGGTRSPCGTPQEVRSRSALRRVKAPTFDVSAASSCRHVHRRASAFRTRLGFALGGAPSVITTRCCRSCAGGVLGAELVALDANAVVLGLELELEPGGPGTGRMSRNTRRQDRTRRRSPPRLRAGAEPLGVAQEPPRRASAPFDGVQTPASLRRHRLPVAEWAAPPEEGSSLCRHHPDGRTFVHHAWGGAPHRAMRSAMEIRPRHPSRGSPFVIATHS